MERDSRKRAEALLAQMTATEKVGQLNQHLYGFRIYHVEDGKIIFTQELNDEEGKRTNAGKRHIRLLQKVVCKSQMAREPFVRAFLTESLFAQREPRRMVRFEHIGTGGPFGAVPQPQP